MQNRRKLSTLPRQKQQINQINIPVDDVGVVVELEGCAIEMDKRAKAQIDKFFLQIF